jgi:PIN domain nuclease of toxin-antitoxin system
MALTAAQLAELHSWVGTAVLDATLNERADRLSADYEDDALLTAVAIEELRQQLADRATSPTQIRSAAGTSLSFSTDALERQLKKLDDGAVVGADGSGTVKKMTRESARR